MRLIETWKGSNTDALRNKVSRRKNTSEDIFSPQMIGQMNVDLSEDQKEISEVLTYCILK